jgi:hypothetical protein
MFSVLDVSVLTVMYGRGCRALVKFEAQQESKRMGKASGLAGEAFYAGRCKKECLDILCGRLWKPNPQQNLTWKIHENTQSFF